MSENTPQTEFHSTEVHPTELLSTEVPTTDENTDEVLTATSSDDLLYRGLGIQPGINSFDNSSSSSALALGNFFETIDAAIDIQDKKIN